MSDELPAPSSLGTRDRFSREDPSETPLDFPLGARTLVLLIVAGGLLFSSFLFLEIFRLERARPAQAASIHHQAAFLTLAFGLALTASAAGGLIAEKRRFTRAQVRIEKLSREVFDRREREQRFRQFLENAPDAVLLLSPEGLVAELNPAAEMGLARPRHDLLSKPFAHIAHPDDRARARELFESARSSRKPSLAKIRLPGTGRDPVFMEFTLTPEVVENRVYRFLAIGRDVSARHQAEAATAALEIQLRAAQKFEALGQLAGGIAHDFNNFLTTILTNCQVARMELVHGHPAVRSLDELNEAARRATSTVQQILAFVRDQKPERQVIALEPVAREAVKLLRPILPPSINLDLRVAPGCPGVRANVEQILQVLLNLGTNAAHAMQDGGGRLDISLDPVTVDEDMAARYPDLRPGLFLRLNVGDTGHGMDAPTLARIFDPCFTTKPPGYGTGLGLSIVHSIVRGHDGAITVSSQPYLGTVFHLYFPAVSAQQAPPAPEPLDPVEGRGRHLLLVGETPALTEAETDSLRRLGYRISVCASSSDALDRFRLAPDQYDCVVGDLAMSGLNGFELAAECRKCKPDIPFVLLSIHPGGLSPDSLSGLGISEVLLKPFPLPSFVAVLQRAFTLRNP